MVAGAMTEREKRQKIYRVEPWKSAAFERLAEMAGVSQNELINQMIDDEISRNRNKLVSMGFCIPADAWLSMPTVIGDYECRIIGDTMIHKTDVRFANDVIVSIPALPSNPNRFGSVN